MKFWKNWQEQKWFPYTVAVCAGVILYMLLSNLEIFGNFFSGLWFIVKPLLYGLILAYLMDPIARFYENKPFQKIEKEKLRRNLSVILAVISVVIVLGGLTAAIIPSLVNSISDMIPKFTDYISNLDSSKSLLKDIPFGIGAKFADFSISEKVLSTVSSFVTDNLSNIASTSMTIGSGFANFLIAFILAIYYMMDKKRLKTMAKRALILILKEKRYARFHDIAVRTDVILLSYIKGNLLEALIVGVANAIFMLIAGLPCILLISIIVGITNMAPTFGPIAGAVVGCIILVMNKPVYVIPFLIFTLILQTIDGYIIKPKLFGNSLGVSPLLILIMIIVGGRLWGVVGILLAIPIAAIAQFLWDDAWKRSREKRAEQQEKMLENDVEEAPADEDK